MVMGIQDKTNDSMNSKGTNSNAANGHSEPDQKILLELG